MLKQLDGEALKLDALGSKQRLRVGLGYWAPFQGFPSELIAVDGRDSNHAPSRPQATFQPPYWSDSASFQSQNA